jgi:hypothetical protein
MNEAAVKLFPSYTYSIFARMGNGWEQGGNWLREFTCSGWKAAESPASASCGLEQVR